MEKSIHEAFQKARSLWKAPELQPGHQEPAGSSLSQENLDLALESARASQKKEFKGNAEKQSSTTEAAFRVGSSYSTETIAAWLAEVRLRKGANGKPLVRSAQMEVLEKVAERMNTELKQQASVQFLHNISAHY